MKLTLKRWFNEVVAMLKTAMVGGQLTLAMWICEVADGKVINRWHVDTTGVLTARKADK